MEEARPHYDPSRAKRAKQRAAPDSSRSSPPASPQPPNEPPARSQAWIAPVVSVLLAALASVFAYNQSPNPNISTGAGPSELAWWLYPYERNAIFNPQREPAPPTLGTLRALRAAERGDHVFAVGDAGTILYSHDGGDSWRLARGDWTGGEGGGGDAPPESATTTESPEDIKRDILALTEQLERTEDAAGTPPPDTEQRTLDAAEQRPLDADAQGTQETKPAPDTPPNAVPDFVAVDADEYGQFVAALADDGSVAISEDAGHSWRRVARTPLRTLGRIGVGAHGGLLLVASDDAPIAYYSRNRGEAWTENSSGLLTRALAVSGAGEVSARAVATGGSAALLLSRDRMTFETTQFLDQTHYFAIADIGTNSDGTALYAVLQDKEGQALAFKPTEQPAWRTFWRVDTIAHDLRVSGDGTHIAYLDQSSDVHLSQDAGRTFEVVLGPAGFWFTNDLAMFADGALIALRQDARDNHLELQRRLPGDDAWRRLDSAERYVRLPAPWLALLWLGVALVCSHRLGRVRAQRRVAVSAIADVAVSDSPLRWDDADHLDFKPLAMSVSAFIRNENTQAPLTIAVTGPWGTGKSSLMRLIEHDLRRNRFRPVWFNAWHAQEETQLLAALLTAVRDQAAPPWWTPLGLRFRARMLVDRGWTAWLKLSALIAALAAVIAAVASGQLERLLSFGDATQWSKTLATLIGTGGGATLLIGLVRALTAFREQPAKLLAAVAQSANVATLDAQLSFRHRFAREFALVTRALEPYTLTIFIDDLDRCLPKQVVDTLEAVNFLTTAGQCVVVFGMARAPVEAAVSEMYRSQFKMDKPASASNADASLPFDTDFAHRYLDKLINLEIPVPRHGAERAARITEPAAAAALDWRSRARRWAHRHRAWAALALLALPLWFAASVVQWVTPKHVLPEAAQTIALDTATTASPSNPSTVETARSSFSPAPTQAPRSAIGPSASATLAPGISTLATSATLLALVVGLAWLFLRERRLQHENILRDSDTFRRALQVWSAPVAQQHQGNPRALKRFVNWLRYLAMADRMQHPDKPIPESLLVGLASLHVAGISFDTIQSSGNWNNPNDDRTVESAVEGALIQQAEDGDELRGMLNAADHGTAVDALLRRAAEQACAFDPPGWPPEERYIARFQSLCAGIVAR
jgi:hypothetical protein